MSAFFEKVKKRMLYIWHQSLDFINNKIGKKKFIIIASVFAGIVLVTVALLIAGIKFNLFCSHSWHEATCTSPRICVKCNKEEGNALEHNWAEADCELPKTCKLCGAIDGEALGHKWEDATCEMPKICSVCQKADGKSLGHDWQEVNCEMSRTCYTCGESDGKAAGHKWETATCDKPKTCSVCKKTEGKAKGHKWQEATIDKPKTCSVCNKTEGKVLDYEKLGVGVVSTDSGGLNLRKEPNTSADKVILMPKGSSVTVYDCNNSKWYYVVYDNKYGYASSEFIKVNSNTVLVNQNSLGTNSVTTPSIGTDTIVVPDDSSAEIAAEYERYQNAVNDINTYYEDMVEITISSIYDYENDPDFSYQYVGESTDRYQENISELRYQVSIYERDTSGIYKSEIKLLKSQIEELNDIIYAINYSNGIYENITQETEQLEQYYIDWEIALEVEKERHESNVAKLN